MIGLTPKGDRIPQTPGEFKYLCDLYEEGLRAKNTEIAKLKQRINKLEQKLEKKLK